ncbi:bacteriocin-like protein [Chryseobacterium angstadtii]|uniref:bacteriocin-like protein n=1 Tax=Chryseobacterium angstadtii TaxID=558151 RepID=UPI000A58896C|nr:hypothetical protein [Chryseobacterium angstadtii]
MRNLKKLSKRDLKTINGGGAPVCGTGYKPCIIGIDANDSPKWSCIPSNLPCKPL